MASPNTPWISSTGATRFSRNSKPVTRTRGQVLTPPADRVLRRTAITVRRRRLAPRAGVCGSKPSGFFSSPRAHRWRDPFRAGLATGREFLAFGFLPLDPAAPAFHHCCNLTGLPLAVLAPVDAPPCIRQRPFDMAQSRQRPCLRHVFPFGKVLIRFFIKASQRLRLLLRLRRRLGRLVCEGALDIQKSLNVIVYHSTSSSLCKLPSSPASRLILVY
jgi:hypothetical protein